MTFQQYRLFSDVLTIRSIRPLWTHQPLLKRVLYQLSYTGLMKAIILSYIILKIREKSLVFYFLFQFEQLDNANHTPRHERFLGNYQSSYYLP